MRASNTDPVNAGRQRAIVEGVSPEIDGGRFAIKRVVGDAVVVEADVFTDGHDAVSCVVLYRHANSDGWHETPMAPLVNDRWAGIFHVSELGRYCYTVMAWVDRFKSWVRDLAKRVEAGQEVKVDLLIGADLVAEAAGYAEEHGQHDDAEALRGYLHAMRSGDAHGAQMALAPALSGLMARYLDRRFATTYHRELAIVVDPPRAGCSAWYELFPRSTAPEPGRHGTFKDVAARLPYVASMGFDVLYLPPIHPIGRVFRKGKNNNVVAEPGEPGSPWAIGGPEGGHKAIHPELGTLDDFRSLVSKAREYDIDVALDIAFQCSPDHPYVHEHPEWFRKRPDGTIQYAENPPKKYQDIYPFDFETEKWQELWYELKSVFDFWIEQGVKIYRVDNPHTKSFGFWEWCISEIKRVHPEVIFLSEAFTRPKVMYRLAKLGFTHSYTYYAWRNEYWELTEYLTELTQTEVREYFRPNFWPNTPDILTEALQSGRRPVFMTRFAMAATLSANYGIYGPAFELMEHVPVAPGKEEYLNSEKYEIKHWELDNPASLKEFIARINRIRKDNPALQNTNSIRFHRVENGGVVNEQILAYTKHSPDRSNIILTVVNLDPDYIQSGWLVLPLEDLEIDTYHPFQVHDLLIDQRYLWNGAYNFVQLDPSRIPVHIFKIMRRRLDEHNVEDFA